jgi:hypothetical protein
MNSRTLHIRIKEWFPPGDEVAALMAQLCVLREDLYLEMQGLHEDKINPLDANGDNYRSTYFFRNSTRTLFEIRNAVETLKIEKTFIKQLAEQNNFHEAFVEFDKAMSEAHELVKRLRHETGGHLDDRAFKKALESISLETQVLFQSGSTPETLHYKFCLEFLGAIFLSKVDKDFEKEWARILRTTADVSLKAINAVDMIFMAYVEQRRFQY